MFFLKLLIMLIILSGLVGSIIPKFPGPLIILTGAVLYGAVSGTNLENAKLAILLLSLTFIAEIVCRMLRIYLTKNARLSRSFCINATAGNAAGILAANTLFGKLLGILLWEIIIGKTLLPQWNEIADILWRLTIISLLRLTCSFIMVFIVLFFFCVMV